MSTYHKQHEECGGRKTRNGVIVSLERNGSACVCGGALVQQGDPPFPVPPYLVNPVRHWLKVGDSVIYMLEFSPKQGKWCVIDLRMPDNTNDPTLGRTQAQQKVESKGKFDPKHEICSDNPHSGRDVRRSGVIVGFVDSGRAAFLRDDEDGEERYIREKAVNPVRSVLVEGSCVTYEENQRRGKTRVRDLQLSKRENQVRSQISSLKQNRSQKEESVDRSTANGENYIRSNTKTDDKCPPNKSRQGRSIDVNIGTGHDIEALNSALASSRQLPTRLQEALGGAEIWIKSNGTVMIDKNSASANITKLRWYFRKHDLHGWSRWVTGDIGWTLHASAAKKRFIPYLRSCHEFYTAKMSDLKKMKDADLDQHLDILFYKVNITMEGKTERQNTERLWTKVAKDGSLQDGVVKVRSFLEVLRFAARKMWKEVPWLQGLRAEERQERLNRVDRMVNQLLRSSEQGPDVPVHWAAHPPLSAYPRAVVTEATMTELVVELTNILGNLFCPHFPAPVQNLQHVDAFLVHAEADDVQCLADEFSRGVRINAT